MGAAVPGAAAQAARHIQSYLKRDGLHSTSMLKQRLHQYAPLETEHAVADLSVAGIITGDVRMGRGPRGEPATCVWWRLAE